MPTPAAEPSLPKFPDLPKGFVGSRWEHVRRGTLYTVVGLTRIEKTRAPAVSYYAEADGEVWTREIGEFLDGRFRPVAGPLSRDAAFLIELARRGIPTDIQELLVFGSKTRGIAPGALHAAIAATQQFA